MAKSKPVLELRQLTGSSWEIVITNRQALIKGLGEPLAAAFCRCFVHVDRLNGLNSLLVLNMNNHRADSIAHVRNLVVIFWYATGTLLEFRTALDDLASELRAARITVSRLPGWRSVEEFLRWPRGSLLRRLRNKIAFHVDPTEIVQGLRALSNGRRSWLFAHGDDVPMTTIQFPFGIEPLLKGLAISKRDMHHLIKGIAGRQAQLVQDLQRVFIGALEAKGLRVH